MILILPATLILLVDALLRFIYVFVSLKGYSKEKTVKTYPSDREPFKVMFVIPVRDDGKVLQKTLDTLNRLADDLDTTHIVVIADNCSDGTARLAELSGAVVFSRVGGIPGKGLSLSWFAQNHKEFIFAYDVVVLLDADTLVDRSFYTKVHNSAFWENTRAFQGLVSPLRSNENVWATLASYSELLSEFVDDSARSKLRWQIPLRGTGMAFRPDLFYELTLNLFTQVEDIEMSIRLALMRIPVAFSHEAIVYDPKSSELIGLARQRGRWLKGQRQVTILMKDGLWTLFLEGLSGLSLLQALLLKPKTLLIITKILLVFVIFSFPWGLLQKYFLGVLTITFLVDLIYYLIGLCYVENPSHYLSALFRSPGYLFVWIMSWFFSIMPGTSWLRARD